jgi:L-glyceraldehyde 3-phosphate reductase
MTYVAAPDRYDQIDYRRCGRRGLKLPEISLGLWQNFGSDRPLTLRTRGASYLDPAWGHGRRA